MSNGIKASNDSLISRNRRRSVGFAIGRLVSFLLGNGKDDPTSRQSGDLYGSTSVEDPDELARELFPRICSLPDDCKWPQEALFNFTREAADRRDQSMSHTTAEPSVAANRRKRLQSEFHALDSEARIVVFLHADRGKNFREIAQLLKLPEEHVLKIIRVSYSQLRMTTLPCEDERLPAGPSRESLPK